MAQVSTSSNKVFFFSVLVIAFAAAATTASAQDFAPVPAPMATGSAYSSPVSGAVILLDSTVDSKATVLQPRQVEIDHVCIHLPQFQENWGQHTTPLELRAHYSSFL
ncbi:hypothetical protein TIFTF001_023935 [Ficus carica]|uniref:Uncharacterized protein n=1 Tax=Ficus carica TaxID=3494 RepID=A0AA88AP94_FICCA|nr:hypothetical protein TIFTF001_023935 [Ficus carica]